MRNHKVGTYQNMRILLSLTLSIKLTMLDYHASIIDIIKWGYVSLAL